MHKEDAAMAGTSARDMTQGSPTRLILGFFFPLLFGQLFQQLYNMVDTMIVGRFLGVQALAGVGSTGSLNFLVMGFCIGICNGFAIPVAQKYGEGDYAGLKRFVINALMTSAALAAVITLAVCLLCKPLLIWTNTPADIIADAYGYLFVIFLGIPVMFLYNILFAIIRSLGDSRTPVMYLIFCSVLNVVLDLIFILWFHMGVAGAAWATVLSQGASALLCVRYLYHSDLIIIHRQDWKLHGESVKHLLGMGIPTGLQYSITALGSIVMQAAVNGLGSVYVASMAAGGKVSQMFGCAFDAMGSTMATYGGQNVGAGKLDRIGQGLRSCGMLGIVYAVMACTVLYFFGDKLAMLFVDSVETEVIANAHQLLIINSLFYIALAFVNIVRFLIQGLGFTRQAVFAGVCEMFARTFVGFVLVPAMGYTAACFAHPAAWVAADLFLFPTYFWAMRKLREKQRSCA